MTLGKFGAILLATVAALAACGQSQVEGAGRKWLNCDVDWIFTSATVGHDFSMTLLFGDAPVQGTRLVLARRDGPIYGLVLASVETDSTGTAHFVAIPSGTYTVSVAGGLLFSKPEIQVANRGKLDSRLMLDWPPKVVPTRALLGRLTTSEEVSVGPVPLPRASVELLDLRTSRLIEAVQTDDNGVYEFSTTEPGLYALRVHRPAIGQIESGTGDLAVELDPAAGEVAVPEIKVLQSECSGVRLFQRIGEHWEAQ